MSLWAKFAKSRCNVHIDVENVKSCQFLFRRNSIGRKRQVLTVREEHECGQISNKKQPNQETHSSTGKNLMGGCGRLPQPEWFSQTHLKKQYHMYRLIYKVLTPGPERISILLGKCFPLGSVSATAYRCFSHAQNARLFPLRHE